MRILVTGSRDWPEEDRHLVTDALKDITDSFEEATAGNGKPWNPTLVVGDCLTGVDLYAFVFWSSRRWPIEMRKAEWQTYGKSAGPRRNQEMVDSGVSFCVGFAKGESRGTRGCVRFAQEAGIPTILYEYQTLVSPV